MCFGGVQAETTAAIPVLSESDLRGFNQFKAAVLHAASVKNQHGAIKSRTVLSFKSASASPIWVTIQGIAEIGMLTAIPVVSGSRQRPRCSRTWLVHHL
jgi:hypothetical protein